MPRLLTFYFICSCLYLRTVTKTNIDINTFIIPAIKKIKPKRMKKILISVMKLAIYKSVEPSIMYNIPPKKTIMIATLVLYKLTISSFFILLKNKRVTGSNSNVISKNKSDFRGISNS